MSKEKTLAKALRFTPFHTLLPGTIVNKATFIAPKDPDSDVFHCGYICDRCCKPIWLSAEAVHFSRRQQLDALEGDESRAEQTACACQRCHDCGGLGACFCGITPRPIRENISMHTQVRYSDSRQERGAYGYETLSDELVLRKVQREKTLFGVQLDTKGSQHAPLMVRVKHLKDLSHHTSMTKAKKISKKATIYYGGTATVGLCPRCMSQERNSGILPIGGDLNGLTFVETDVDSCQINTHGILSIGYKINTRRYYQSRTQTVSKIGLAPIELKAHANTQPCSLCLHANCKGECLDGNCRDCNG